MNQDLFGMHCVADDAYNGEPILKHGSNRRGEAGELLALADLKIRGYEAGIVGGVDTDIVANINDIWRLFQVKASSDGSFNPSGAQGGEYRNYCGRRMGSYKGKIDAFAFVGLPMRMVYYVSIDAISVDTRNFTINNFSRQACNLSFEELLRRWGNGHT